MRMARQRWLMMQAPQQRFPCASIKRTFFSILNRALCEYLFWPNEPFARQLVLDRFTAIICSCVWHTKYTCADILSTTHRLLMRWQHTATYCNTLQHTGSLCVGNTLQLTATHCNTLQHTGSLCVGNLSDLLVIHDP